MIVVLLLLQIFITLALVGVILMQRSEGGALGIGGGPSGLMSGRAAGDVLTRATSVLAAAFFVSSLLLTVLFSIRDDDASILESVDVDLLADPPAEAPLDLDAPAEEDASRPEIPVDELDAPAEEDASRPEIPIDELDRE